MTAVLLYDFNCCYCNFIFKRDYIITLTTTKRYKFCDYLITTDSQIEKCLLRVSIFFIPPFYFNFNIYILFLISTEEKKKTFDSIVSFLTVIIFYLLIILMSFELFITQLCVMLYYLLIDLTLRILIIFHKS